MGGRITGERQKLLAAILAPEGYVNVNQRGLALIFVSRVMILAPVLAHARWQVAMA